MWDYLSRLKGSGSEFGREGKVLGWSHPHCPPPGLTPTAASAEALSSQGSYLCQESLGLSVPNKLTGHRLQESGLFNLLWGVREEESLVSSLWGLEAEGPGSGNKGYYTNGKTTYERFVSGMWNQRGSIQTALKNYTSHPNSLRVTCHIKNHMPIAHKPSHHAVPCT